LFTALCGQVLTAQEGAVGIGDTDPDEAKLVVRSAPGFDALYLNNPIRSASPGVGLFLQNNANSSSGGGSIQISGTAGIQIDSDDIDRFGGTLFLNYNSDKTVNIARGGGGVQLATGSSGGNVTMVTSSGNVGIGTGSPSRKLDVEGDARISSRLFLGNNPPSNNTGAPLQVGISNTNQNAALLRNNSSFSNGGVATLQIVNEGNAVAIRVDNTDCRKVNGGEWFGTSDRRLKQDINGFHDGLEQIRKVRPVTFRYNEKTEYNTEEVHIGIIAQELQEIAPYMVKDQEEYLAIDGSAFKYMLINAVQEQDQIITDQQKEIDELKARLDRIEALLKK